MPSYLTRIPARWRKTGLGFAVVCVSAVMIMLPVRPSPADGEPSVETVIAAVPTAPPVAAKPAPRPRVPRPAAPAVAPAVATTRRAATPAERTLADPTPADPTPADATPAEEVAAVAAAAQALNEPATIVGCLGFDDDRYRLTETDGEDAPKSRSWKSGFLRRSNARLDVTDSANRLRLASHVGHRVSVTGTLVEREMQARSLKMVATTCDE